MSGRRRFAMALAASAFLHLAVLLGPVGPRSALDENSGPVPPLTAHLVQPAAEPSPVAPVAVPLAPTPRARRVKKAPPDVATAALPATTLPPAPEPPVDVPVEAPTETVAQADEAAPLLPAEAAEAREPGGESAQWVDLPRAVRIRYAVTMGDNGFVLGRTLQEFRQDGARYAMRSTATTTGLANIFKPANVVNLSEGEIVKGRLQPREYRAERGKGKTDSARFNWEESRVALADGRELELRAATQDMLSVFFQLALMVPTDAPVISVPVVTGRKLEQYDFEVVGEASIDTPLGPRRTMHLRTRKSEGRDSTEVWLSLDDSRLPVKIRHVDRKGEVFEQVADKIDVELPQERAP